MENIINNPGLKHLTETIFGNLNLNDLKHCRCINESSKQIFPTPMFWRFWLKNFIRLSKKNSDDWIEAIQAAMDTEMAPEIILYFWDKNQILGIFAINKGIAIKIPTDWHGQVPCPSSYTGSQYDLKITHH